MFGILFIHVSHYCMLHCLVPMYLTMFFKMKIECMFIKRTLTAVQCTRRRHAVTYPQNQ